MGLSQMRCLHIQLQPELCTGDAARHIDEHITAMEEVANAHDANSVVDVQHGDDNGAYTNINIYSDDAASLWIAISGTITNNQCWASATIVCCEGDNGWEDYYLLHHFDETQQIDTLA